mmetsp:Transcript_68275/g.181791  ORF Transcript_68275/g.181791 Transcript_68275/m.181791 type:complete len:228 (+) Transcript_68275:963-1646(+)
MASTGSMGRSMATAGSTGMRLYLWRTSRAPTWTSITLWPSRSRHPRGVPARGPRRTPRTCTREKEQWSSAAMCPCSTTPTGSTDPGGGWRGDRGGVILPTSRCCPALPRTLWWCTEPGAPRRWRQATDSRDRVRHRTRPAEAAGRRGACRPCTTWATGPRRLGTPLQRTPRRTPRRPSATARPSPCTPPILRAQAALSPSDTQAARGRAMLPRRTWRCSTSREVTGG